MLARYSRSGAVSWWSGVASHAWNAARLVHSLMMTYRSGSAVERSSSLPSSPGAPARARLTSW
ncbi:MAG: hypothetical protein AUG44_28795 [Actinobacteria bacterium 13_1_20CM_3_71_11]|nr:MAG: hypothetical protein AUG44_28795 [Actinobacteria bacterium 13_1_20CM_3_71_11]